MRRFQRLWFFILFAVLTFAVAVTTLDFKLARVTSNANTTFSDARTGKPGLSRVLNTDRIYLHVENREGLGGTYAWEMRRQLQRAFGLTVTLLNNDPGPGDFPLVVVAARDVHTTWTPFYAHGSATLLAKFSSHSSHIMVDTGAAIFEEDTQDSKNIPLVVSLNSTVESSALGLVSLPSFRNALLRDTARGFAEHVKKSIEKAEASQKDSAVSSEGNSP